MLSWRGTVSGNTGLCLVTWLLQDDVGIVLQVSATTGFDEQLMQISEGRDSDTWCTHLHARAGDRVQHPRRNNYDYAGRDLDMNHLAVGTPLPILPPHAAAKESVPPIENLNILPDMGRMTA